MVIENFYREINGDYESTVKRLGSKALVSHFVNRFCDDKTFENLCMAYRNQDIDNAFLAVHTLKGICANLGFSTLQEVSSTLTEILRKKTFENSKLAYDAVVAEYEKVIQAIKNN